MPRTPAIAAVADRIASCGRWLLLVLAVTVIAKFATAATTTALLGGSRRESLAIGFMLDCRGLTDFIPAHRSSSW
jgi:Kef-type K+ transport system membrane component KefB